MKFEIGEIAILVCGSDVSSELRSYAQNGVEVEIAGVLIMDRGEYVYPINIPGYPFNPVVARPHMLRKRRPPPAYKDQHTPCEKHWQKDFKRIIKAPVTA